MKIDDRNCWNQGPLSPSYRAPPELPLPSHSIMSFMFPTSLPNSSLLVLSPKLSIVVSSSILITAYSRIFVRGRGLDLVVRMDEGSTSLWPILLPLDHKLFSHFLVSQCSLQTSFLCHCRLRHPSFSKLKDALPWITLCDFKCESCELGKHHHSSYPAHTCIPSSRPFDLVHCNVWGPAQHASPSRGRYYIVFVDDYTQLSWIYIIKSRKEVITRVQEFFMEVTTQYATSLNVLRTDNALEFTQNSIHEFCTGKGILHQTTCPYTFQKNGEAERKHRHVLDVVRTLLVGMNVPMYLWSDVFLLPPS